MNETRHESLVGKNWNTSNVLDKDVFVIVVDIEAALNLFYVTCRRQKFATRVCRKDVRVYQEVSHPRAFNMMLKTVERTQFVMREGEMIRVFTRKIYTHFSQLLLNLIPFSRHHTTPESLQNWLFLSNFFLS